jgi:hypothetical protein
VSVSIQSVVFVGGVSDRPPDCTCSIVAVRVRVVCSSDISASHMINFTKFRSEFESVEGGKNERKSRNFYKTLS